MDAQKRAERDASKKAAKAEARAAAAEQARLTAKIEIRRVERNKRKYVTAVSGLEQHGLDLKKLAKDFGKRFATGASVTKSSGNAGHATAGGAAGAGSSGGGGGAAADEIVVQGDLTVEIEEWLLEHYGDVIPEGNIEIVEDRKKKAG